MVWIIESMKISFLLLPPPEQSAGKGETGKYAAVVAAQPESRRKDQ